MGDSAAALAPGLEMTTADRWRFASPARNRRTKCRQTRYSDPKLSPLHETGTSPTSDRGLTKMRGW
jgi:hypothetical protein